MNTSQAILVRFCGPTNCRGSRYIARCQAGRLVFEADHALNPDRNAYRAAVKLALRLGWWPPSEEERTQLNTRDRQSKAQGLSRAEEASLRLTEPPPHAFGTLPNGDYVLTFGQASDYASPPAK